MVLYHYFTKIAISYKKLPKIVYNIAYQLNFPGDNILPRLSYFSYKFYLLTFSIMHDFYAPVKRMYLMAF